jgi:alkanesulfonate monooxygenase SsuD/methylene tetrahydromethanopterin reductase-like flavin-dependent oxidoreductase (luciferase family)
MAGKTAMKRGLFVPPFDELADPRVMADMAASAEEVGWDGIFLWDHIQYPDPITALSDSWICLSAIASRTKRIRIGALVTPLARRRPLVLARQAVALDVLSGGRMVLGLSVGGDWNGEMAELGESGDMRERASMLDEGLVLLDQVMRGEAIEHRGQHYAVSAKAFLPTPLQTPRIPIWIGARWRDPLPTRTPRPFRRAAQWDGVFPDGLEPDGIEELRRRIGETRAPNAPPFTVVASATADDDPGRWSDAGADWLLTDLGPRQPDGGVRSMQPLAALYATIESL